jgi:hypothetical protein
MLENLLRLCELGNELLNDDKALKNGLNEAKTYHDIKLQKKLVE